MQEIYTLSTRKRISPYLILLILCIFLYLPSSFLRYPFSPDEARNIYIAKNIHSLSSFLFPKYLNGIYYEKPPLYFWLLKLFSKFPQVNILLPSILFNALISWMILSLNYLFLKKEGFEKIGIYSSLILATLAVFYATSIILRMDILFLFFIFLSIFFFLSSLRENKNSYLLLSSLFSFLAVFTKGAFGMIFPFYIGLSAAFILKEKKVFGKVIFANSLTFLLILSWLFSFTQIEPNYFKKMVFEETLFRGFKEFGHTQSFFYYFIFLLPLFLPWFFLGVGYFLNFRMKNKPFWEKLYLFWFIGGFIILSFIRAKLHIYLLLLSVPFAGLVSKFLCENRENLKRILFYLTGGFFLFIWFGAYFYFNIKKSFIPSSAFFILIIFLGFVFFIIKRPSFIQFRVLFIFWLILIQAINLFFIPLASNSSKFKKIVDILKERELKVNSVYVDSKSLLLLEAYSLKKPLIYLENKEKCPQEPSILISRKKICPAKKISQVGKFIIFYKEK